MSEQKSTPDPELLNQIAKEYEISKKFLGTAEGMSELEAEVDKSIPALVLLRHGFDYGTIVKRLGSEFPVAKSFAEGKRAEAYSFALDIKHIVSDLSNESRGGFDPHKDEFVLLMSIELEQNLFRKALHGGTMMEFISKTYPKYTVMVLPDNAENAGVVICAIAKVAGRYYCSSRYGI